MAPNIAKSQIWMRWWISTRRLITGHTRNTSSCNRSTHDDAFRASAPPVVSTPRLTPKYCVGMLSPGITGQKWLSVPCLVNDVLQRGLVDFGPTTPMHSHFSGFQPLQHLVPQLPREVAGHHGRERLSAELTQHPTGLRRVTGGGTAEHSSVKAAGPDTRAGGIFPEDAKGTERRRKKRINPKHIPQSITFK